MDRKVFPSSRNPGKKERVPRLVSSGRQLIRKAPFRLAIQRISQTYIHEQFAERFASPRLRLDCPADVKFLKAGFNDNRADRKIARTP